MGYLRAACPGPPQESDLHGASQRWTGSQKTMEQSLQISVGKLLLTSILCAVKQSKKWEDRLKTISDMHDPSVPCLPPSHNPTDPWGLFPGSPLKLASNSPFSIHSQLGPAHLQVSKNWFLEGKKNPQKTYCLIQSTTTHTVTNSLSVVWKLYGGKSKDSKGIHPKVTTGAHRVSLRAIVLLIPSSHLRFLRFLLWPFMALLL